MSSLGKRSAPYGQISKRAKTSAGRQIAIFRRSAAMSSRYNRSMSARLQRAPGVSGETGYVDLALAPYAMDTTGSVTLLNTVAQGASVSQRVGKKIQMRGLQCRGYMQNNSAGIANDVAFLIVYDKRPTGSLPAVTDILVAANAAAFNNDNNAGRFTVLKRCDELLLGNSNAAANYLDSMYKGNDFFLDLKNRQTVYKAAGTGAIGDIEEGALYLVTVGNTTAGTSAAVLAAAFRMRFKDI